MVDVPLLFDESDAEWVAEIQEALLASGIQAIQISEGQQDTDNSSSVAILFLSRNTIYSEIQEWASRRSQQQSLYIVLHNDLDAETGFSVHIRDYQRRFTFFAYPNEINELIKHIQHGSHRTITSTYQARSTTDASSDGSTDWQQDLRTSWVRISHDVRVNSIYYDDFEFSGYEINREANLATLRDALQHIEGISSQSERQSKADELLKPLYCLRIPKDNERYGESRELYFARPETSLLLQVISDLLVPVLESQFLDNSYANRMWKIPRENVEIFRPWAESYKQFKLSVREFARNHPDAYVYRGDIRRFYPSIDVSLLLERLQPHIVHHEKFHLIEVFLRSFLRLKALNEEGRLENVPGLPAGIPLSHLLANFYLHTFDQFMVNFSLEGGYFRYADDVFVFLPSRADALQFQDQGFQEILPNGLSPHPDKSDLAPAIDRSWLETILDNVSRHLHPANYIGMDSSEQQQLRTTLIELLDQTIHVLPGDEASFESGSEFWTVADHEEALVRYGTLIIDRLRKLGQHPADIDTMAFELLRVTSLRVHHIRRLVGYFVERLSETAVSPTLERFLDPFLRTEAPDYIRIAFLQALRHHIRSHLMDNDAVWRLILDQYHVHKNLLREVDGNELNIFILGEAALALYNLPASLHQFLDMTMPINNRNLPGNFFQVTRDWYLFARYNEIDSILSEAALEAIDDPEILDVFLYIIQLKLKSGEIETLGELDGLIQQARGRLLFLRSVVRFIELQLVRSAHYSDWDEIAGLILDILHGHFYQTQTKADILDYLSQEKFPDALIHYIVPASRLLRLPSAEEIFNRYNISLESNEHARLRLLDKADYQIRFSMEEKPRFAIEVFRANLLPNNGFTVLQWEQLLIQLHRQNVIHLVETVQTESNIIVIYRIPASHDILSDNIVSNLKTDRTVERFSSDLQCLQQINQKAEIVHNTSANLLTNGQKNSFRFITPFPSMVLVTSLLPNILLTGVGASLVRTHRYAPAIGLDIEQENPDEIGFFAYTKFFGFLLFELVNNRSPIQELHYLREQKNLAYLTESDLVKDTFPHIPSLLLRLTNSKYQFRYQQYNDIDVDLRHIISFCSFSPRYSGDDAKVLEFVDYMGLRMRSHQRNPQFKDMNFQERLQHLMQSIRKDFQFYHAANLERRQWLQKTFLRSSKETDGLDRNLRDWLQYTSRHLWQIHLMWLHCLKRWEAMSDRPQTVYGLSAISLALLIEVVRIETLVYAQVIARASKRAYKQRSNFGDLSSLASTSIGSYVVDFTNDSRDEWPSDLYSLEILQRVIQMLDNTFVSEPVGIMDVAPRKQVLWLEELTLFILFMGDAIELYDSSQLAAPLLWRNRCMFASQPELRNAHLTASIAVNELLKNYNLSIPSTEDLHRDPARANFDDLRHPISIELILRQTASVLQKIHQANHSNNRQAARITYSHPQFTQGAIKNGRFVYGTDVTAQEHSFRQRDLVPETPPQRIEESPEHYIWAKADNIPGSQIELAALVPYVPYFRVLDKLTRRIFICHMFSVTSEATILSNHLHHWGFDVRSYSDAVQDTNWWSSIIKEIQAAEIVLFCLPNLSSSLSSDLDLILKYVHNNNRRYVVVIHGTNAITSSNSHIPTSYICHINSMSEQDIFSLVERLVEENLDLVGDEEQPATPALPALAIVDVLVRPSVKLFDNNLQKAILQSCEVAMNEKMAREDAKRLLLKFRHHPNCQFRAEIDQILSDRKTKFAWKSLSNGEKILVITALIAFLGTILAAIIGVFAQPTINVINNIPSEGIATSTVTLTTTELLTLTHTPSPTAAETSTTIPTLAIIATDIAQETQDP